MPDLEDKTVPELTGGDEEEVSSGLSDEEIEAVRQADEKHREAAEAGEPVHDVDSPEGDK